MSQSKADRVEVVNKKGAVARPLRKDLSKWLDAGWKQKAAEAGQKEPKA